MCVIVPAEGYIYNKNVIGNFIYILSYTAYPVKRKDGTELYFTYNLFHAIEHLVFHLYEQLE
jgi:hypothetical protein